MLALVTRSRYHAQLKQLVHSPLAEMALLHGPTPLVDLGPTTLPVDGTPMSLGNWTPLGVGNASDLNLSFALPAHMTTFNVRNPYLWLLCARFCAIVLAGSTRSLHGILYTSIYLCT